MKKIYAVCRTLEAGYPSDQERFNRSGIQIGDKIELEDASVGSWMSEVWLVGHEDPFNSVFFDYVDEDGEPYNIYRDKSFSQYM